MIFTPFLYKYIHKSKRLILNEKLLLFLHDDLDQWAPEKAVWVIGIV